MKRDTFTPEEKKKIFDFARDLAQDIDEQCLKQLIDDHERKQGKSIIERHYMELNTNVNYYADLLNSPKSYPDHPQGYMNRCVKCTFHFLGIKNYPICNECAKQ